MQRSAHRRDVKRSREFPPRNSATVRGRDRSDPRAPQIGSTSAAIAPPTALISPLIPFHFEPRETSHENSHDTTESPMRRFTRWFAAASPFRAFPALIGPSLECERSRRSLLIPEAITIYSRDPRNVDSRERHTRTRGRRRSRFPIARVLQSFSNLACSPISRGPSPLPFSPPLLPLPHW